jgi:ligand-binding SRPBCC domain-containing protein
VPVIRVVTDINGSRECCFDLARSIDLHAESMSHTSERPVAGVTSGLIGLGQEVTWEAVHFLTRQRLTSRITSFNRPYHFRDSQVRGAFRRFDHDHFFEASGSGTKMIDVFDYTSPFGPVGTVADWLFLERYMRALIERRAQAIKKAAEIGGC